MFIVSHFAQSPDFKQSIFFMHPSILLRCRCNQSFALVFLPIFLLFPVILNCLIFSIPSPLPPSCFNVAFSAHVVLTMPIVLSSSLHSFYTFPTSLFLIVFITLRRIFALRPFLHSFEFTFGVGWSLPFCINLKLE